MFSMVLLVAVFFPKLKFRNSIHIKFSTRFRNDRYIIPCLICFLIPKNIEMGRDCHLCSSNVLAAADSAADSAGVVSSNITDMYCVLLL